MPSSTQQTPFMKMTETVFAGRYQQVLYTSVYRS